MPHVSSPLSYGVTTILSGYIIYMTKEWTADALDMHLLSTPTSPLNNKTITVPTEARPHCRCDTLSLLPPLGFPSTHNNLNRFRLDEECNSPHHCSFRLLLSHTVGEESESIRDESESGERPPWRGMQLPLPKGLQIVKVEHLQPMLISSGAF